MQKDRQRGQALERHVGKLLGGRRRRNGEGSGFDDCVGEDGQLLDISVECKAPAKAQFRWGWIEQARRNAAGRPWVLAQRPLGSQTIYATTDLDFLVRLLSEAGYLPSVETPRGSSADSTPAGPGPASPPGASGPTAR